MVYFKPAEAAFKTLKDKVVVMSGAIFLLPLFVSHIIAKHMLKGLQEQQQA